MEALGRPRGKQPDNSSDVRQETHQAHYTFFGFAQSAAHMDIYQLRVASYVAGVMMTGWSSATPTRVEVVSTVGSWRTI